MVVFQTEITGRHRKVLYKFESFVSVLSNNLPWLTMQRISLPFTVSPTDW